MADQYYTPQELQQLGFTQDVNGNWHFPDGRVTPLGARPTHESLKHWGGMSALKLAPFAVAGLSLGARGGTPTAPSTVGGTTAGAGAASSLAPYMDTSALAPNTMAQSVAAGAGAAPSWLQQLIKGGGAAAIQAIAKNTSGSGGGAAGSAVDSLIPELVKRFQTQNARVDQSGPLYDAVLKMAQGRLPVWARG